MNVTRSLSFLHKLVLLLVATVKGIAGDCIPGSKVTSIRYSETIVNHTIVGPIMSSITAENERECEMECHLAVPNLCYMFNYYPSSRVCELLYKDRAAEYKVEKKNGSTFKTRKCISDPCPLGHSCVTLGDQSKNSCVQLINWDDVWTQWTSWTACHLSADCNRTRTRNCTNPAAPQNIGTNCTGPEMETKECLLPTVITTGCENPLGMEDGTILDSQITASSFTGNDAMFAPKEARLNNVQSSVTIGAWGAGWSKSGEYIQVDLGIVKMVTRVATQGRPVHYQWLTEYSVSYSNDTSDWPNNQGGCVKKFPGNVDRDTVVTNKFEIPIIARYIRVIVQKWNSWPSMRMELYGCTPP